VLGIPNNSIVSHYFDRFCAEFSAVVHIGDWRLSLHNPGTRAIETNSEGIAGGLEYECPAIRNEPKPEKAEICYTHEIGLRLCLTASPS